MTAPTKRITPDEARAARNLLDSYERQVAQDRHDAYRAERESFAAIIGELGSDPRLIEWAEKKRQADLVRGLGLKSDPDRWRLWCLERLRDSLLDVCQAWDLSPAAVLSLHAAPELLEAAAQARSVLQTALADYAVGSTQHGVIQARIATLNAAIAKARGGAA